MKTTELASGTLKAVRLTEDKLPEYKPHHKAKHELLVRYMPVWLSKLGFTYDQVVLIDGFASAGRYRADERGSPLIMLDNYVGHRTRSLFKSPPHFVFIESNKKFAQHLKAEVETYPNLHGATVDIVYGKYKDAFLTVSDYLAAVLELSFVLQDKFLIRNKEWRSRPVGPVRPQQFLEPRRSKSDEHGPLGVGLTTAGGILELPQGGLAESRR